MDSKDMKEAVSKAIDSWAERAIDLSKAIELEPELGFKEFKTSKKVQDFFKTLGLETETGLAVTGVKAKLKGKGGSQNPAILGELDGIICKDSPKADRLTGASHACGHHLQIGAMLLAAAGLAKSGIAEDLFGDVTFMAVPAEEFIEIEERTAMRAQGKIAFLGGKQELIRLGAFDGVTSAMMVHAGTDMPEGSLSIGETGNGFVAKTVRFIGKAAHAAAAPDEGINALNAAVSGINNVNAMRETFKDDDHVRVHFIITKGGDTVNSVPSDVRLEAYVRAKTLESVNMSHGKFDRAMRSGGDAIGAATEIHTIPGYLPLACDRDLNGLFEQNALGLLPRDAVHKAGHFNASTDMGDLCHIMPSIHPYTGGVKGALHSKDFTVLDYKAAVLIPAKAMAMTVVDLLADCGKKGRELLERHKPLMTKGQYLKTLEGYFS